jgi:hypothetical protein
MEKKMRKNTQRQQKHSRKIMEGDKTSSRGSMHLSELNVSDKSNQSRKNSSRGSMHLSELNVSDKSNQSRKNSSRGSMHLSELNVSDKSNQSRKNSSRGSMHLSELNLSKKMSRNSKSSSSNKNHKKFASKRYTRKMMGGAINFSETEITNLKKNNVTEEVMKQAQDGIRFDNDQINTLIKNGFTEENIEFLKNKINEFNKILIKRGRFRLLDTQHLFDTIQNNLKETDPKTNLNYTPNDIINTIELFFKKLYDSKQTDEAFATNNQIIESNNETVSKGGRKMRKTKGTRLRQQRGGMCYGNGVGANGSNPNFSVYNTNLLKLFPYRP